MLSKSKEKSNSKSIKQQTFTWVGINKKGERVDGETTASSMTIVKIELRRQGIQPQKVQRKRKPLFGSGKAKIKPADIAIFSRQLATMLTAGIPLIQAFEIVGKGNTNLAVQALIFQIKNDVEAGSTLSEALGKHPKYFNDLFCSLVEAGEQSGSLETMLSKIATYLEKTESIKGKIKKALFYPTAVIIVAIIVTVALLVFVVPQFESLFKGFGADLPALTRMVINMSMVMQQYWWMLFLVLAAIGTTFVHFKRHSKTFSYTLDRLILKFPVIGEIMTKAAIARFTRTLSITFGAGLPLVDALKSVAGATGNILFANASLRIRDDVSTGQQMQQAMKATQLFPAMVVQMVAIGEESGSLETMLGKVADFYEEEVDNAVDGLSSLLEPIIMAILGVLVGGLVIAMYLPIFKLGSVV